MGTKACPVPLFRTGQTVRSFLIVRIEQIHEIRATAYEIKHHPTGAKIIHLHCEDKENLFSIGFRTPPSDSTGAAHILEHSVLAGSEKYPVKDAFNELAKGTLQTFINAFTYPDKTIYPVASQVKKDFYNLVRVYIDLVLHPRILRETFFQEGHHLEFKDPNDPNSELTVSGIVFNEMKGVYSDPDSLMWKTIQENLYSDTVYAFDSGGNPEVIPYLTHDKLKEFHHHYYSPSNAYIFLYGDITTDEHLVFLEEALSGFSELRVDSHIEKQTPWTKPAGIKGTFPIEAGEKREQKTAVNLSWILADHLDHDAVLILKIISKALIGNAASPLRKALIDSGLGEDLSPVTGLESDLRQISFTVGLRGTDPEKASEIESLILGTLKQIADNGFEREIIEAALHQTEFGGREIVRRTYPYSIRLMTQIYQTWLYDGDPFAGLRFTTLLKRIRSQWKNEPDLFERMLSNRFIENHHRLLSVMEPSENHNEEREKTFQSIMKQCRESLSAEDIDEITRETILLKKLQEESDSPEAAATLPKLQLEELPREGEEIPTDSLIIDGMPVLAHDLFTNGITYLDLAFDVCDVPEELQAMLPMLGRLTTSMGAAGLSYIQMAKRIGLKTGALDYTLLSGLTVDGMSNWQKLVFSIRLLDHDIEASLDILMDILCAGDLDNDDRISDLILEKRNRLISAIVPSGHIFARRTAAGTLSIPACRDEQWYGRSQLQLLDRYAQSFIDKKEDLREKVFSLRERIFRRGRLTINVTAEGEQIARVYEKVKTRFERISSDGNQGMPSIPRLDPIRRGISIATQVNYVAKAVAVPTYSDPLSAALMILSRELSGGFLYNRIRVQGGAYGGLSVYDPMAGHFSFLSYRDPHLVETLKVYDEAIDLVTKKEIPKEDFEKAVIGTIALLDKPMDPAMKGFTAMIRNFAGLTEEVRRRFRERVLDASPESLREAAANYLSQAENRSAVAVYASAENLETANKILDKPLRIEPLTLPT
jgi:hypothetical protein